MAPSPTLTLSQLSLSLFLLFFFSLSSSYATSRLIHHRANSHSPAQKLIRSFNLFPKYPINTVKDDPQAFVSGRIVEKKFSFLADSEPSIQDLGHHAGYYSLPSSKAARYIYIYMHPSHLTYSLISSYVSV